MASAVPSYEELLDEAKKQPISISWNSNTYKEVKENERYYVTNEIGLCGWNDLGIALIDFQTQEKVWLTCRDLLIDFMIYKEKEDCLFFYEPDSELNVLLLDKGRTAKPYITQEEFLRYFKELIGDKNVYFKFAVCKGASRFRFYKSCVEGDMDDDVFIERYVREHIIVNIYKATGI